MTMANTTASPASQGGAPRRRWFRVRGGTAASGSASHQTAPLSSGNAAPDAELLCPVAEAVMPAKAHSATRQGVHGSADVVSAAKGADSRVVEDGGVFSAVLPPQETWPICEKLNLGHQTDGKQKAAVMAGLRRLRKCLELSLASNELDSLAGVTLPACRELHLSSNRFASFKELPRCPKLQRLGLQDNLIETLDGLGRFRRLISLELAGNPVCCNLPNYAAKVFRMLPRLQTVDGVPRAEALRRD